MLAKIPARDVQNPGSRIQRAEPGRLALWIAAVLLGGTVGYAEIEGVSLVDALSMTVITVSTVGFREIDAEPSTAGSSSRSS